MMKSTKCEGRLRESVGSAVVRLCAALLVVFAVAGCGGDNRISLEEFLEIQQRLDQAPGARTRKRLRPERPGSISNSDHTRSAPPMS